MSIRRITFDSRYSASAGFGSGNSGLMLFSDPQILPIHKDILLLVAASSKSLAF